MPMVSAVEKTCDLLVVGGGINGCGIARDAAGRGLSVILCEQDDLAAHTSSASTKLIHGGLRYLEQWHFKLVRKSLLEREVLLASAPHLIRPLRFVMPHDSHLRPMFEIRAGLFLYDHLAPRKRLAASKALDLHRHPAGSGLDPRFRKGFIYSDAWTDDARLVVLNARDAAEHGATVLTRVRCEHAERRPEEWRVRLMPNGGSPATVVYARALVNAAGPWVANFLHERTTLSTHRTVRLIKGSHIIVPQLFRHRFAYIFQNVDRRIVFAIPYEREFTLIGTTDVEHHGQPQDLEISATEVEYLCATVNRYFTRQIGPTDVVHSYAGVRPLLEDEAADAAKVTRDYALELDTQGAPILNVFGGKITTFRRLAEEAVDQLCKSLQIEAPAWTRLAVLPGGDLPGASLAVFLRAMARRFPWLPPAVRERYARGYGTRIGKLIGAARTLAMMGEEVLPGLYEREIDYLCGFEWAHSARDILWRRTKLGLHLPPDSEARLDAWLADRGLGVSGQFVTRRGSPGA
ncbi:MAG TPA: glycerol-3-phosphate dehydrogenase [Steroidobacteraceae bacterium]|nr:glycerol-3-phosphate dehydrogenase [Steroidobacteraceae bacterium]